MTISWSEPTMMCSRVGCPNVVSQSGVGRERRYCSDTCRAMAGRVRRQVRESIELSELLVAATESRRISALASLSDAERRTLRRGLLGGSEGPTAGHS